VPDAIGTITGSELASAVTQVHIAAETNESLVNLTGIHMEFASGVITLAATDRYRLALRDMEWNPSITDPEAIALVPASKLNDIAKGLADCDAVEIAITTGSESSLIGFSGGGRSIATALLGYQFPRYRDTIPAPGDIVAYVETAALSAALKRVRLVLEDKDKSFVSIMLSEDEITVTAQGVASGLASEAIEAQVSGEAIDEIRFDPNRFIDGLNAIGSPYVKLAFINSNKPVLLTAAKEPGVDIESGYKYWLMPKPINR
jgi:DNA polymerase-3 subunit beta